MKRFAMSGLTLLVAGTVLAVVPVASPAGAQPPPVARQGIVIEPQQGADIYTHTTNTDYRVGPALVTGIGNTLTQYTCGPNPAGPGDVIRSRYSSNGGGTWTPEQVVLQPNPAPSGDEGGVCDPSIVKVGNYYYLAYTGTLSTSPWTGLSRLFLARSTSLGGPFTKWNGTDWNGGYPAPLNTDTTPIPEASGPSLVVKDGTLYLYYNARITTGPAAGTYQTRLATASLGTTTQQPTWPTRLTPQPGVAIEQPRKYTGLDCVGNHWPADTDVKYDDTTGKWLAITSDQGYPWSALQAYESTDGHTFTKAIITRGDYQRGARNPGQLANNTGHITPGNTAIAYAHSTTCGQADLRVTTTTQHNLTTGAINQPLTSASGWSPQSGTWSISPSGYYQQTQDTYSPISESTLTGSTLGGSSTITVQLRGSSNVAGAWVGVHFDKAHPTDTRDQSGYTATVEPPIPGASQVRLCLNKAGFGNLACRLVTGPTWTSWMQMTIVQSNGAIKVYLNGDTGNGIASTDANDPYLGGYLALATNNAIGNFTNLTAGDNVPGTSYTGADWQTGPGWEVDGDIITSGWEGQADLWNGAGNPSPYPVQLGDGTYAADITVNEGIHDPEWGGIALSNNGVSGDWATGGYLVFLRANGKLGIYKAGAGQVVPDIDTGTDPTDSAVRVRVVKTGANFQVYVQEAFHDASRTPVVNWTDTNPAWAIGGFGLASTHPGRGADFRSVTYNANYARSPIQP